MGKRINNEDLLYLYSRIKPLVSMDGNMYALANLSLEELLTKDFKKENIYSRVNEDLLVPVEEYKCTHKVMVSPTIKEILANMPVKSVREANFFEIVNDSDLVVRTYAYKNNYYREIYKK